MNLPALFSPVLLVLILPIGAATHKRFRDNSVACGSEQKKRRTDSPPSSSSESFTETAEASSSEGLLSEEVRESITIANNILNDSYMENDRYT